MCRGFLGWELKQKKVVVESLALWRKRRAAIVRARIEMTVNLKRLKETCLGKNEVLGIWSDLRDEFVGSCGGVSRILRLGSPLIPPLAKFVFLYLPGE